MLIRAVIARYPRCAEGRPSPFKALITEQNRQLGDEMYSGLKYSTFLGYIEPFSKRDHVEL